MIEALNASVELTVEASPPYIQRLKAPWLYGDSCKLSQSVVTPARLMGK